MLMPTVWLALTASSNHTLALEPQGTQGVRSTGYAEAARQVSRSPTSAQHRLADTTDSEFWYTNRSDRIKLVVDKQNDEIRVSRIIQGQYTGQVERYRLDDFAMLTNSLVLDGFVLDATAEPESPPVEAIHVRRQAPTSGTPAPAEATTTSQESSPAPAHHRGWLLVTVLVILVLGIMVLALWA